MQKYFLITFLLLSFGRLWAHPMPNTVVNLSIGEKSIQGEAKMPLLDLQSAMGSTRSDVKDAFFSSYFTNHIKAISANQAWTTTINTIELTTDTDEMVGRYQEVLVHFTMAPPAIPNWRQFTFDYNAIIHQVVTHKIIVFIQQDWRNGIHSDQEATPLGVIEMDVRSEKVHPLEVNLEQGSWWKGFSSMVRLGMQHIKEGTDHLLFLIVLLLPATLLVNGKRWSSFGGIKYSLLHLLRIVTAFTIGHSLTLLIGALGWVQVPSQPIEILIAVSILISAVHAIYPVFPGREMYIALGFGLIHGMAFAGVLSNMNLGAGTLAFSIFGFNLGIELMQLFIIALVIPWLILLSQTAAYSLIRISGAALSAIAAGAWVLQRSTGQANVITNVLDKSTHYGVWAIGALAITALVLYRWHYVNVLPLKRADGSI